MEKSKRIRVVKWQKDRVVKRKHVNWKASRDFAENVLATERSETEQDILDELDGFNYREILEPGEARMLKLFVSEGKTPKEIGQAFNIRPTEVGKILQRVGRKIKKHLEVK